MFSTFTQKGNRYGERYTEHEMERAIEGLISDEMTCSRAVRLLEKGPLSVAEISEKLGQPAQRVLRLIMSLARKGTVSRTGIEGPSPKYSLVTERMTADVR